MIKHTTTFLDAIKGLWAKQVTLVITWHVLYFYLQHIATVLKHAQIWFCRSYSIKQHTFIALNHSSASNSMFSLILHL